MLSQTLPLSSLTKYVKDEVHVFSGALSWSRPEKLATIVPDYIQALRSVCQHLELARTEWQESFGIDRMAACDQASRTAEAMKQFVQSKIDSGNRSESLIAWSAILQMRDFLHKTFNRLSNMSKQSDPCAMWLGNYAKSHFQVCKILVEAELEKITPTKFGIKEMERLHTTFTTVLQYELALFESASLPNNSLVVRGEPPGELWDPINIIFTTDYDVTCTIVDSCESLVWSAEGSLQAKHSPETYQPGKLIRDYNSVLDAHDERIKSLLSTLENEKDNNSLPLGAYAAVELEQSPSSSNLLPGMDPTMRFLGPDDDIGHSHGIKRPLTVDPYDEKGLRHALALLGHLEEVCNEAVMAAGVLGGSTREAIRTAGKRVILRDHCGKVLQRLTALGNPVHVVSANWSRDLILGGLPELQETMLYVHCNDLIYNPDGVSTGEIDGNVQDAFDKENIIQALRKIYTKCSSKVVPVSDEEEQMRSTNSSSIQILDTEENSKATGKMTVYLGDSYTDLLGLLEADLGIVMGQSQNLRRVLSLYGIQMMPLAEASESISIARSHGLHQSYRRSGILFEASGWDAVEACLFGSSEETSTSAMCISSQQATSSEACPEACLEGEPFQKLGAPTSLDLVQVAC